LVFDREISCTEKQKKRPHGCPWDAFVSPRINRTPLSGKKYLDWREAGKIKGVLSLERTPLSWRVRHLVVLHARFSACLFINHNASYFVNSFFGLPNLPLEISLSAARTQGPGDGND
jgi:hypothetical protein